LCPISKVMPYHSSMNSTPLIPETKLRSGFPWELTLKQPAVGQSVERLHEKSGSLRHQCWRNQGAQDRRGCGLPRASCSPDFIPLATGPIASMRM
jgi:hypothetical protein